MAGSRPFRLLWTTIEGGCGLRLREVVGDFREAPSWGSAFPGGGAGMQLFQRRVWT